ncbi:MAG: hypothetical protein MT490_14360 [Sphingomonas sp.]|uniref:hypothetical protein n=1 Tax=Sphingomonas sp. TaxID=28214 RepID=UPI0022754502|nr:hypothetical protein [Sphingomonas sp.]MCX8476972.1 hypothetical protein [Sphingomonas sp.]
MANSVSAPKRARTKRAAGFGARDKIAELFAPFLSSNDGARIAELTNGKDDRAGILDPWQDASVALLIPDDPRSLAAILADVYLPPRYSAIYHKRDKRLEVIWTAYKLDEEQEEVKTRKFSLRVAGKTHKCEFGPSSDTLLTIAKSFTPLQMGTTNFRNLRSFREYSEYSEEVRSPAYATPVSFWIDNLTWDNDSVIKLIRHINFYLKYYDAASPVIEIFPEPMTESVNPRNRYIEGSFPNRISSKELEAALLIFYSAAYATTNPASNFLNFYRIIEFVSYGHMHGALRGEIRKILNRPSAVDDVERSSTEILFLLREAKLEREQDTIVRLLQDVIPVERLWNEISQNKAFFAKNTCFEGDLVIDALVAERTEVDTFAPKGVETFARSITQIRNALAHGKDSKSAKAILPTSRNFELLRPWVHLIAVAAGEVVLYDGGH